MKPQDRQELDPKLLEKLIDAGQLPSEKKQDSPKQTDNLFLTELGQESQSELSLNLRELGSQLADKARGHQAVLYMGLRSIYSTLLKEENEHKNVCLERIQRLKEENIKLENNLNALNLILMEVYDNDGNL